MNISKLFKTKTTEPYVMGESENYIIFNGYNFHGPDDVLEISEALRNEGYRVLSFGHNGGVFCEKPDASR